MARKAVRKPASSSRDRLDQHDVIFEDSSEGKFPKGTKLDPEGRVPPGEKTRSKPSKKLLSIARLRSREGEKMPERL